MKNNIEIERSSHDSLEVICYICETKLEVPAGIFDQSRKSDQYLHGGIKTEHLRQELENKVYISGEGLIYCGIGCWSNMCECF